MKKNIAVIFGGRSPEYFVSLQSAYSVITNIDHDKYNVIPIGVTLEGGLVPLQRQLQQYTRRFMAR